MNTDNPILNSPYEEPEWHIAIDNSGSLNYNKICIGGRIFTPDVNAIPSRQGPQSFYPEIYLTEQNDSLENIAKQSTRRKAEKTLKIEIDDEAFDRLYGFRSHPIEIKNPNQKIAVRVVSQFGEESTKVVGMKS